MRLLPGWLAAQAAGAWTLDGDESIRRRPVDRIAEPLTPDGCAAGGARRPLPAFTVHGARLHGIEYVLPLASAQVKSCLLLAGLLAGGQTTIVEPARAATTPSGCCSRAGAACGARTAR